MLCLPLARLGRLLIGTCILSTTYALGGCTSVVGARFDEAVPAPTQCDLVRPQTSDPRAFLQCDTDSTCAADEDNAGTFCAPLRDSRGVGDACQYINDCAPGMACSPVLGCVPLCETGTLCDDGSACTAFVPDLAVNGRTFGFCLPPSCDPIHPTAPAPGLASCSSEQCRFVGEARTACFATGRPTRPTGNQCDDDLDCAPSDSCFEHICKRLCRTERNDCRRDEACVAGASDVGTPLFQDETFGHCDPIEKP